MAPSYAWKELSTIFQKGVSGSGRRLSNTRRLGNNLARVFPFRHRLNAKSKYSVGDEVDILYDPRDPSHVMLDSWGAYILCTILLSSWFGIIIVDRIHAR